MCAALVFSVPSPRFTLVPFTPHAWQARPTLAPPVLSHAPKLYSPPHGKRAPVASREAHAPRSPRDCRIPQAPQRVPTGCHGRPTPRRTPRSHLFRTCDALQPVTLAPLAFPAPHSSSRSPSNVGNGQGEIFTSGGVRNARCYPRLRLTSSPEVCGDVLAKSTDRHEARSEPHGLCHPRDQTSPTR